MEVTILKNKMVLGKDWQSLDDIKYTDTEDHLGQLVDCESKPVFFFPHQKSIVEDVLWRDVIDAGNGDEPICAIFKIEETGIKRYVLKMNGKNIIAFDFSDDVSPQTIEGILPPNYYLVGRMFFECIHWTRDFLEYRARKILDEMSINKDVIKILNDFYNQKRLGADKHKYENKYSNIISDLNNNINREIDFELKYLLSQVEYIYSQYEEKNENKSFIDWVNYTGWAKIIMQWGEGHSIANVEFSNYSNFIKIKNSYFGFDNMSQRIIYGYFNALKEQRNLVSHNIRNLVEQKWTELSAAVENMKNVANKLGNMTLYDSLDKRKGKIELLCKEINGITK